MKFLKNRKYKQQMRSSRKRIIEDTSMLVKDLQRLTKRKPKDMIKAMHQHMLVVSEINALIAKHFERNINKDNKEKVYSVSSLFLRDSFKLLNKRPVESLHFVTGPEIKGTKVLDRIVDFTLEQQSTVYAKADTEAVREALIYLSRHEFKLWGCFHIHPGNGVRSIHPSGTDMTLDRLLARGGYECIGAIFSRDGFVRFFSSKDFEINIYGNGVEKINEKIYRITEVN